MQCIKRLKEYEQESIDVIILKIRNGTIKTGRYANLVKVDKDFKIKKNLFTDKGGSKMDIKVNEDNNKKYTDTIAKEDKKKKKSLEESVNNDQEEIQYFTE